MRKKLNKYYFLIILVICLSFPFPTPISAAVQIDSSSREGQFDGLSGVTNLTWPHTVGGGVSRALYVGVSTSVTTLPGTATDRVSSVTYNGLTLTRVGTQVSPLASSNNAIEIFRLVNPPSGTANIVVSIIASRANYAFGSAVSFTGVNPANPEGSFFSNFGSNDSPTITVTDSVTGDLVFDTVSSSFNAQSFVAGANQSVCFPTLIPESNCRRGRFFFGGLSDVGASSTEPATSPVTMSWTLSTADDWALGAIAVKAFAPTAASGTISGRVLSSEGRGIPRVLITLSGGTGEILTARSNPFGFYHFEDIELEQTYILQANSKRYVFAPRIINLNEEIKDLNLIAIGK